MRYCRSCGHPLSDTDRFCPSCGKADEETAWRSTAFQKTDPIGFSAPAPHYPGPTKWGIHSQIDEKNPGYHCMEIPADALETVNINCKIFNINIVEGNSDVLMIRWINNRFRTMHIRNSASSVSLEDEMAVDFYGLFRALELITDNTLEIQIPPNHKGLYITGKLNANQIEVDGVSLQSLKLYSASGAILIRNVSVEKSIDAHSISQNVLCQLPGNENDYDIDCKSVRKEYPQPVFHSNPGASRKIILRSDVYVPELSFTGGTIR